MQMRINKPLKKILRVITVFLLILSKLLKYSNDRWFIAGSLLVQIRAMEKNKQLLAACLAHIETALGWGNASDWSNADFDNLSDKIFEKTGTRLSLSTLRR